MTETTLDLSRLNLNPGGAAAMPAPTAAAPTIAPTVIPNITPDPINEPVLDAEGQPVKYQHYTCSRISMNLITPEGHKICFVNFKFITQDTRLIAYLDEQISFGMRDITKGELLTADEADPMAKLKAQHFAEFQAKQDRLMRAAEHPNDGPKNTILSTSGIAALAADSGT